MSLNVSGTVDANGGVVLVVKNDAPLKGFLLQSLTTYVANEPNPGTCSIYRDNDNDANLLTVSGFASDDKAVGPYWLGSGSILVLVFSGLTPGNIVQVSTTGTVTNPQERFQQGNLRFGKPPRGDVVPTPTYPYTQSDVFGYTNLDSLTIDPTNPLALPENASATYEVVWTAWPSVDTELGVTVYRPSFGYMNLWNIKHVLYRERVRIPLSFNLSMPDDEDTAYQILSSVYPNTNEVTVRVTVTLSGDGKVF